MNNKSTFFEEFFSELNGSSINYCIMNGYENYPNSIGSDIDICVGGISEFERFISMVCDKKSYELVQRLEHHYGCVNYFIANKHDKKFEILSLDVYAHYVYKNSQLFNYEWFLRGKVKFNNFYIPKPENEFIYYLVKKIVKQDINEYIDSILLKYPKLSSELDFSKYFPQSNEAILKSLELNNKQYFIENKEQLKIELDSSVKSSFYGTLREFLRLFKRILFPTGFQVSFLGPDGSGKSTIIEGLEKRELPFRAIHYFHLKPRLLGAKGDGKPVPNPHDKKTYLGLLSYLKLLHFVSDYIVGFFIKVLPLKIRSSLIIFDRYYDDILIDPKRFRYGGSLQVARLMKIFIPQPQIYFVLIAEPEVIYKRKQEVTFEELVRQVKEYRGLLDGERYFLINVDRDVEDIIDEIQNIMYEKLGDRY